MKLAGKIFLGLTILVLGLGFVKSGYGEQYCPGVIPPDRLAADYVVSLIRYFGGGEAKAIPPDPGAQKFNYTIQIRTQPQGGPLNEDRISLIPSEVIANLPGLRSEAINQGISVEERIKQFIEGWLQKRYPGFMEVVRQKEQEYRTQFETALNTLLEISDKSQLSEEEQQHYERTIDAYIEQIKEGFNPQDLVELVSEYMPALKPAVASFIKTATGEDFSLFNPYHAGFLTYWADWAFSYARPAEISKEEAIEEASAALADREELVNDVNEKIFNGQGDPLSGEFGRILSYFADMVIYKEYDYDRIREEINIFSQKMEETREKILPLVSRLGVDTSGEEGQKIVERFNLLLAGKLFEIFDEEAMDEFAEEHEGETSLIDDVRYSRYYTFEREDIKASYVSSLGAEEFFGGVEYQEVMGRIAQYIDDMLVINDKFQEKFGKSYDTTTLDGVEKLLNWALGVELTMNDYIRRGKSVQEAHQSALNDIFTTIDNLESFPEEEAYLGDTQFAVDVEEDGDIPLVPSEPVVVDDFSGLL